MRRPALAAYEEFSRIGKCPECNGRLVDLSECETACSSCGIVVAEGSNASGSRSPEWKASEPLGSYVVTTNRFNGGAWEGGFEGRMYGPRPNSIGRNIPFLRCSALIQRVSERLLLPKSVSRNAALVASRLLPSRKGCHVTMPAIAAYSVLYACRSAGLSRVGYNEIFAAFSYVGYRVGRAQFLRIGIESALPMPASRVDALVGSAVRSLQCNKDVMERLRRAGLDERAYFAGLFEASKEIASDRSAAGGSSPRTVAAGSVYLAGLSMSPRVVRQTDAARALEIAEYTVREFCSRVRRRQIGAR